MKPERVLLGGAVYDVQSKTSYTDGDGVTRRCPYYMRWKAILIRVFSENSLSIDKRYIGCAVCDEWMRFSKFKTWMEQQRWYGYELDKDILGDGSLRYSPATCAFISKGLNSTITTKPPGACLLGVTKKNKKFAAQVSDGCGGKTVGSCRNTQEEAHFDYLRLKLERLSKFVGSEHDDRINKRLEEICILIEESIKNETVMTNLYGREY